MEYLNEWWEDYDKDEKGELSREEIARFVKDILDTKILNNEVFDKFFKNLDTDGNE